MGQSKIIWPKTFMYCVNSLQRQIQINITTYYKLILNIILKVYIINYVYNPKTLSMCGWST